MFDRLLPNNLVQLLHQACLLSEKKKRKKEKRGCPTLEKYRTQTFVLNYKKIG